MSRMDANQDSRSLFSSNLIKYRKIRGLSQVSLAEKAGISKRMIAYYETQISNPPINNVMALAKALDISVAELIGESNDKHVPLFEDVDPRTLKKIMLINKLSRPDRATIYNMIDALLTKSENRDRSEASDAL